MDEFEDNFDSDGEDSSDSEWSEELERMPLKQRLILLLAQRGITVESLLNSEPEHPVLPLNASEAVPEKNENELCDSQHLLSGCTAEEQMTATVPKEERDTGGLGELRKQENIAPNCKTLSDTITTADTSEKVDSVDSNSLHESFSEGYPVTVKVECADIRDENPSIDLINCSSESGIRKVNHEPEMTSEFDDELDNVVLKERLRRLMIRKYGLTSRTQQENSDGTDKGELIFGDQTLALCGIDRISESGLSKDAVNPYNETFQELGPLSVGNKSTCLGSLGIQRSDTTSEEKCFNIELNAEKTLLSGGTMNVQSSDIPSLGNIKTEPANYDEFQSSNLTTADKMSTVNLAGVKTEAKFAVDSCEDYLDCMLLRDRMKLLSSKDNNSLNNLQNSECMSKEIPSPLRCRPFASIPAQPVKINRPRKKRRTVTDSVETAMEEDAPGLLQVLIGQGVSVNEIKLYGEPEINDALDDSSPEDNFAELESVITKLFSQRESFLKLGSLRCMKAEKASYCLECLFSLVEQARYLQFRSWPVEWGWCRDLHSFIFVFERHNRIVLERPEYGYATYFFELADSLPIDWQIKRLVTAMKLTSCSRITLIENKALMLGDDLTEGEARVLMEYGWIPNTSLGTMLNYYDRVVHDRRSEKDSSEWRSKIGKLLMDGYNGGTIVPPGIPKKVMDYDAEQPMQVKLELD